jgi:hypothetical protein
MAAAKPARTADDDDVVLIASRGPNWVKFPGGSWINSLDNEAWSWMERLSGCPDVAEF